MRTLTAVLAVLAVLALAGPAAAQKKKQLPPADGTQFLAVPHWPKYVTADVEFRDPAGAKWPNFFYGKPSAAGSLTWDAKAPKGDFALTCEKMAQKNGEQTRKVLADLLAAGPPPKVEFVLKSCGAPRPPAVTVKNGPAEEVPFTATLTVGAKTTKLEGAFAAKFTYARDAERPESGQFTFAGSVPGTELGLASADPVGVTVRLTAFVTVPKEGAKK